MVLETLINYITGRGRKRTLAESDLPIDAEHVHGGSKRFRNATSQPQSADCTYTTSQPLLPTSSQPLQAHASTSNAPPPARTQGVPLQQSKSLSSLDTNKRITIAPPTLAPSNFKFTYTASQTLPSSAASASEISQRPERKLKKNPNGPISYNGQWKSSKKLNRYASPAFQVPARKTRPELKDTYEVPADSKRRKVAEVEPSKQTDSQPTPSSQVPSTSTAAASTSAPRTAASSISPPKPSSVPSLPRLRTPAKPTTPAKPSPLRQTWSSQPTQTATLMAELITKTELPKKPDVSNPYQTANPVANAIPPRRATRRTKKPLDRGAMQKAKAEAEASAQKAKEDAAEKEKDKLPYVSAQAQIEATLPPGSKRSRPPSNFTQRAPSPPSQTTSKAYIVEEVEDDSEESSRSAKRTKPSSTSDFFATSKSPGGLTAELTIVDLDEVDNSSKDKGKGKQQSSDTGPTAQKSSVPVPTTPSPFGSNAASRQPPMTMKSIPKEPSKLRNSFFPETTASSPTSSSGAPSPPPTATSFTAAPAVTSPKSFSFLQPPQNALNITPDASAPAFKATPPSSSSFTFKPAVASPFSPSANAAREAMGETMDVDDEAAVKPLVRAMDEKSLPVYEFVLSSPVSPQDTSREHVRGREDAKVLPAAALPSFAFDGKTDGVKAGSASSGGFKFDLPGSSRSPGVSAPAPAPAPAAGGFNWAAAGMKVPDTSNQWVCAVCAVKNALSATKCMSCDADKPGAAAPSASSASTPPLFKPTEAAAPKPSAAPAVVGFNWAAAGMKAPDTSDKWICADCAVPNVQSAKKCVSCDADKPGASSSSSAATSLFGSPKPAEVEAPKPPAPPAVVGFNWAGAGMKAPEMGNKWKCSECGLLSDEKATQCSTCDAERPGAAASASSSKPSSTASSTPKSSLFGSPKPVEVEAPKPPAVPAVVGFNWAAAGMKAPDTSSKWTCSQCGLLSEESASQCTTCDAPR